MKFFRCDGRCGRELVTSGHRIPDGGARLELTIERADMSGGGGIIPRGTSHLCADCASTAFAALGPRSERELAVIEQVRELVRPWVDHDAADPLHTLATRVNDLLGRER